MNYGKNAMNAGQSWNNFCLPAKIYIVVMVAVVVFNMYNSLFTFKSDTDTAGKTPVHKLKDTS